MRIEQKEHEGRPPGPGARPSPYGVPGRRLCRARPGRMEEMTVPLDMRNDIRSMDADGVPNAEMEDMSPAPPLPAKRR